MTELVTDSDQMPGGEAAATSNNGVVTFGPRESQLARARDSREPTGGLDDDASVDTERDEREGALRTDDEALRDLYGTVGRARGAFWRALLAGPAAWPVANRRHPSVLEVFRHVQGGWGWNHPGLLVRLPVRGFWIADALWETGCMTARVWFRTRITWAITVLGIIAYLVWRF